MIDAETRRPVWDLPTRVFHWSLVLCVLAAWQCAEYGVYEWHERFGVAVLVLVVTRIAWGIYGSRTARFTSFVRPREALAYAKALKANTQPRYEGHNPLGGLMVVAVLAALCAQATLGLFSNDDMFFDAPLAHLVSKDLSDQLTFLHHVNFSILLTLLGIHIAANLYYHFRLKDDLIIAMFTGTKTVPAGTPDKPGFRPAWLWLLTLIMAALLVTYLVGYL